MKIAVTGGTGFIGEYIVRRLSASGHQLKCWYRHNSKRDHLSDLDSQIDWIEGNLEDFPSATSLISECQAVVHNALWRPGADFRVSEGSLLDFAHVNLLGTLNLMEASVRMGIQRFVFVSTCAVHERILDDRPLDETHPLWPESHYGAHKAALEKFVHSFGWGHGLSICAIRPTGVYGLRHPVSQSKWFELISDIVNHQNVEVSRGGKEVHASDVAKAIELLLTTRNVAGQAFACYDRYISQHEVATIAKEISHSKSQINGKPAIPLHQIVTDKIRSLGMQFGSTPLLRQTITQLADYLRS